MSVTLTQQPKNINPTPDHPTNNVDADKKALTFPYYLLVMMMPNTIGSFVRSYRRNDNDYSMAVFGLLVFSVFVLVDYCMVWYLALPKHEKSNRKFWMKVTMWVLYTGNSFGFVYLFSFFFSSQVTVAMYVVVLICSAVMLYAFIIRDLVGEWMSLNAGKTYTAYSVLENV